MKMNRILMFAIAATLTLTSFTANAKNSSKTFTLSDKVGKNQLQWKSSMPAETIDGTAEGITGWLKFDPNNPDDVTGTISTMVSTMQSGNAMRDGHMHSETWLNAGKYPSITFSAKKTSNIVKTGTKFSATVTGDFTMHGVTKEISIPIEVNYIMASGATAKRAPGDFASLTAEFTVALKDFNVKGREGSIGSKVGETIQIKANLFGSSAL